jgi:dUTP pyrophosphatase
MSNPVVKFKLLHGKAQMPMRATSGAACWDLVAAEESYLAPPRSFATVGTGVAVELPPCHVGLVCSRSGLASKEGVFVLNAPGIIDEDYRGELKVVLARLPRDISWPALENYLILPGLRIAQLMVLPLASLAAQEVLSLSETTRGANGLGSTGV